MKGETDDDDEITMVGESSGARDRSTGCGHTRTHARHRGGDRHAGRGAVPAVPALLARAELDERPERPGLRRRHVAPVLPAQPVRHPLGQHELGPRHQHGPRALGGAATRDPADIRRERRGDRGHLLGFGGGRRDQQLGLRHSRGPAHGGGLHERLHSGAPDPRGPAGAVARLQPRPRPDLDEVRGQPRLRPRVIELPRPEGLPVHEPRDGRVILGHGGRRGSAVPGGALAQRRPQDVDASQ